MNIGRMNRLTVIKQVDFGVYLNDGNEGEILLPTRYVPQGCQIGDEIDVFIYADSEDRLIATTEHPYVMVDECAYLKVVAVNRVGTFLNWGLPKDLLVPFNEQHDPMEVGKSYVVFVYLDSKSKRIAASTRHYNFLHEQTNDLEMGQAVDLLIIGRSDLGYKAVINHTYLGLIFQDEVFQPLRQGQKVQGTIKNIREDGKIDLKLQQPPHQIRTDLPGKIVAFLQDQGGTSTLTDKCTPDEIYKQFQVSKSNYKKALGSLYKDKKILIEKHQITLLEIAHQKSEKKIAPEFSAKKSKYKGKQK